MHVPSRPVAAFDPEGLIFAAGINSESIKLYDLRSFDKVTLVLLGNQTCSCLTITYNSRPLTADVCIVIQGPFSTFKLEQVKDCEWTCLKFSVDGKMILVTTNGPAVHLIDAFQGSPLQTFVVSLFVY